MVSRLEIESLVNSAQCPTRVEASVATKDQVKTITMNDIDLDIDEGPEGGLQVAGEECDHQLPGAGHQSVRGHGQGGR